MRPPIYKDVSGRRFWKDSQSYRIEYAVWSLGVARLKDITAAVNTGRCMCLSQTVVCTRLRDLVGKTRVERIARGVYQHVDSPFT